MKHPAYGIPLMDRRRSGERIGLLVVGVHDWKVGQDLEARPNVARVVVPADALPHEFDWSCAVALDCLVCGECNESVFYAAALMLFAAGAASVWGQYDDGVWRLERCSTQMYRHGLFAAEGPFNESEFPRALKTHREYALMVRAGVYGTRLFDAARVAMFDHVFGPLSVKAQAWVAEKRGISKAGAA